MYVHSFHVRSLLSRTFTLFRDVHSLKSLWWVSEHGYENHNAGGGGHHNEEQSWHRGREGGQELRLENQFYYNIITTSLQHQYNIVSTQCLSYCKSCQGIP